MKTLKTKEKQINNEGGTIGLRNGKKFNIILVDP